MAAVFPVIHVIDHLQALREAGVAAASGADGVFVISMKGDNDPLIGIALQIKNQFPVLKIGLNMLGMRAFESLRISADFDLDMTWSDDAVVSSAGASDEAHRISKFLKNSAPAGHQFFASVAFKYKKVDLDPKRAAENARTLGFIPTTSGTATGIPPEIAKLSSMSGAGAFTLGIASGVSPDNADAIAPLVSHILIATGVSTRDGEFDAERLRSVIAAARRSASYAST